MCNKCLMEEECMCLKEAMKNVKSQEGLDFIRDFLRKKRENRIPLVR